MKRLSEADIDNLNVMYSTITFKELSRMSANQKNELLNSLIEKGLNKTLTKNDEQILKILTAVKDNNISSIKLV